MIETDFRKSHLSIASTFGSTSRRLLYCISVKISINAYNYFHSHHFIVSLEKRGQCKTATAFYIDLFLKFSNSISKLDHFYQIGL